MMRLVTRSLFKSFFSYIVFSTSKVSYGFYVAQYLRPAGFAGLGFTSVSLTACK